MTHGIFPPSYGFADLKAYCSVDFLIKWNPGSKLKTFHNMQTPKKFTIQIFCNHLLNLLRENLSFAAIIVATTQKTIRISRHSNIIVISCILARRLWGHKNIDLEERIIILENIFSSSENICCLWQKSVEYFSSRSILISPRRLICCYKNTAAAFDFIVRLTNLQIFLAVLFCQMKKMLQRVFVIQAF